MTVRWRIACRDGDTREVARDFALGLLDAEARALSPRELHKSCGPHTAQYFDESDPSTGWLPALPERCDPAIDYHSNPHVGCILR